MKPGKTREEMSGRGTTTSRSTDEIAAGPLFPEHLLVVEDHPSLRQSLRLYFEFHGYQVATADGFDTAMKAARQCRPDVVICDWQLGSSQDGVDVARELQKRFLSKIIFVSGASITELKSRTPDLAVLGYFKKPVTPDLIEGAIRAAP